MATLVGSGSSSSSSSSNDDASSSDEDSSTKILVALDDEALVEVLLAAKAAGVLGLFASSSRRLCSLARSRVPVELWVSLDEEDALLRICMLNSMLQSSALGVRPFSVCTRLNVRAWLPAVFTLVMPALLAVAGQTALQHIGLEVNMPPGWRRSMVATGMLDAWMGAVIGAVPATLPNLGSIYLHMPAFGVHCARNLAALEQLTSVCIQPSGGAPELSTAATADLTALSRLTNLRILRLWGPPPVQPAAGPGGPYSLPSSLTCLDIGCGYNGNAVIGCWVTHLPGCPQLRKLDLQYNYREHASAHPAALLPLLAQHNRQLRSLSFSSRSPESTAWGRLVAGLPDPRGVVITTPSQWSPDAALATLTELKSLGGALAPVLVIGYTADWRHLAQLSALTELARAAIVAPPSQLAGGCLALLDLQCRMNLSGRALGEVLVACPRLQRATVLITCMFPPALAAPTAKPLHWHGSLQHLSLYPCSSWGPAAAAHFAELAPVLSRARSLTLEGWPRSNSSSSGSSRSGSSEPEAIGVQLPGMSPCTALTALNFGLQAVQGPSPEEEQVLCMLAPVTQLRHLIVSGAHQVTARVVLTLQHMLPKLQYVELLHCGKLPGDPPGVHQQQQHEEEEQGQEQVAEVLLAQLRQLLRPGLVLELSGCDY